MCTFLDVMLNPFVFHTFKSYPFCLLEIKISLKCTHLSFCFSACVSLSPISLQLCISGSIFYFRDLPNRHIRYQNSFFSIVYQVTYQKEQFCPYYFLSIFLLFRCTSVLFFFYTSSYQIFFHIIHYPI